MTEGYDVKVIGPDRDETIICKLSDFPSTKTLMDIVEGDLGVGPSFFSDISYTGSHSLDIRGVSVVWNRDRYTYFAEKIIRD